MSPEGAIEVHPSFLSPFQGYCVMSGADSGFAWLTQGYCLAPLRGLRAGDSTFGRSSGACVLEMALSAEAHWDKPDLHPPFL